MSWDKYEKNVLRRPSQSQNIKRYDVKVYICHGTKVQNLNMLKMVRQNYKYQVGKIFGKKSHGWLAWITSPQNYVCFCAQQGSQS